MAKNSFVENLKTKSLSTVIKDNVKDKIELEIGDTKDNTQLYPQAKIMRWGNEINFSLRSTITDTTYDKDGDVFRWNTDDQEVRIYEKPEVGEDGGLEVETILYKKPKSNIIEFSIQTKGLSFYYQPEITDEEAQGFLDNYNIARKCNKKEWTQYLPTTLEGCKRKIRPENVVGSYAVYHDNKEGNYENIEYKTGKAFHIYRPKITDAEGNIIWGELNIDKETNLLTVTIDEKFLDNAIYPVVVDPTFGYTSVGASTGGFDSVQGPANGGFGGKFTGAAGTLTDLTVYLEDSDPAPTWSDVGGSIDYYYGVYEDGTDGPQVDTVTKTVSSDGWNTQTFPATQQTITAQDYWLYCYMTDYGGSLEPYFFYKYDSTGGDSRAVPAANPWQATLDDADFYSNSTIKYSIYATYTASGGGGPTGVKTINDTAIAGVKTVNDTAIADVKAISA